MGFFWEYAFERCQPTSGNFFLDDEVLREDGVTDFDAYAVKPGMPLLPDLFLQDLLTL